MFVERRHDHVTLQRVGKTRPKTHGAQLRRSWVLVEVSVEPAIAVIRILAALDILLSREVGPRRVRVVARGEDREVPLVVHALDGSESRVQPEETIEVDGARRICCVRPRNRDVGANVIVLLEAVGHALVEPIRPTALEDDHEGVHSRLRMGEAHAWTERVAPERGGKRSRAGRHEVSHELSAFHVFFSQTTGVEKPGKLRTVATSWRRRASASAPLMSNCDVARLLKMS